MQAQSQNKQARLDIKDRPLTREQQQKVIDYREWAERKAVSVWRESAPRGLGQFVYLGDTEDAKDYGIQGLIAAAQRWPLVCPHCKGRKVEENLHSGIRPCPVCSPESCKVCVAEIAKGETPTGHAGLPHNPHTAWHTYARLSVVTCVRNELFKRIKQADQVLAVGKTGSLRKTGRRRLDDDSDSDAAQRDDLDESMVSSELGGERSRGAGPGVGPGGWIWTASSQDIGPGVGHGVLVVDVGVTSTHFLAPSLRLRRDFPVRSLACCGEQMWKQFSRYYARQIKRSLSVFADEWEDLITTVHEHAESTDGSSIVLSCSCGRADRCHRSILGDVIARATEGEYMGEV